MNKIKIAVASESNTHVDTHFGRAKKYLTYEVDLEEKTYSQQEDLVLNIPQTSSDQASGCFGHDTEKLESIGKQLEGISYILVEKIGPKPQKILMRYEINCLETSLSIDEAIQKLIEYITK